MASEGHVFAFPPNLLIALITGAGTLLSMLAGTTLYRFLRPELATLIGGLAMIGIGVWVIVQATGRLRKAKSSTGQLQDPGSVISRHVMFSHVMKFLDDPFFLG